MTKEQYQKGIEKMLSGTKEERIFLASESLGLFCLFYFQHYFKYGLSDYQYTFISDMEDITECNIRELLLITFREGAKTTFAKTTRKFCYWGPEAEATFFPACLLQIF